ncbi:DUF3810 family protein [Flavobacteriaceae bacterium TP-CH-4]|uniref:DUF3810 family protein n=1 Tax=Pelagihabitans pacificus TaxID=2696054 RepID=A0A967B362_9FLAO|nr:DUF3810 domain-containing protein [Pelagihabitans pacificus]NHF61166.1 DUF3810 family protein [Pelagihabitans pacificus]
MKDKLRNGIALSLLPQFLVVKWLGTRPEWVEEYYSKGLYPVISKFFRWVFGWVPFSVGELIYTALILVGIWYLVKKRKQIRASPLRFIRNGLLAVSVFYFTFHLLWGLNYYRQPIADNLGIRDSITRPELLNLTQQLITKTNEIQFRITGDSTAMVAIPYSRKEIFDKTIHGYGTIEKRIPFLQYQRPSIKKSMYSTLSSYLGIGGYLNPFTNEAQVNALTPVFRFPVISGHEVAHQVGYSAENETNFIGYLVTMNNEDIYFQYAAYAYALSHCLSAIARTDVVEFDKWYAQVNEGTKKNYQELRDFYERYENPFEPIFESIFNTFLKVNNQQDGIASYGRVVSLLVGYHEKYPL